MPLFRRREPDWEPPRPICGFVVRCAADELPAVFTVVHPEGEAGALTGFPVPQDGEAAPDEVFTTPMKSGDTFWVMSPQGALLELRVEDASSPLPPPEIHSVLGIDADMLDRLEHARFEIGIALQESGQSVPDAVVFATSVADRVAALAHGAIDDITALRFIAPGGWRVEERIGELDVREHVAVHAVSDETPGGTWVHTHGLVKFGRPEFEVYDIPKDLETQVAIGMNDLSQYVMGGALVKPGDTLGDPGEPVCVRLGGRDREHWEETPVLELVDLGEEGPAESGAARSLTAWFSFQQD